MNGPAAVPPRCPIPRAGDELRLRAGECRYLAEPLALRVQRARPELSGDYDGAWLWVDGWRLGAHGLPEGHVQLLVSTDAIERECAGRAGIHGPA